MDWVEIEGETSEEVEAKALEALQVSDVTDIEIEELKVVRKFMGMAGKTIKARARLKGEEADPMEGYQPAQTDNQEPEKEEATAPETGIVTSEPETRSEEPAPVEDKPLAEKEVVTMESLYRPWIEEGQGAVHIPKKGKGFGRRLYDPEPLKDIDEEDSRGASAPQERIVEEEEEFVSPTYEDAPDSPIEEATREMALEFVNKTISGMGFTCETKAYRLDDRLLIQIITDSAGLLIGHRGETLEAVQYLTDIIVNRHLEHRVRIILDTEGYRERRKHKIFLMAKRTAEDAIQMRKAIPLSPMNPSERRIVHTALAENDKVKTMSEGEGSRRRVVITPVGVKPSKSFGKKKNFPRKRR